MAELPERPKAEKVDRLESLSKRGAKLSESGIALDTFREILSNTFEPESNHGGIINVGTSENYLMLQDVADFIAKNLEKLKPSAKDFSYGEGPWGSPRIREAMAKHINRHFKPARPIEASRILFASGVTSLCEMLGFSICDDGDAILLSKPIYQAFKSDFGTRANVKCVFTDFHGVDQFSLDAVAKYEEAINLAMDQGVQIRSLVICHPHNPLGRCYTSQTLIALMQLCNKYKIHLLADEIYALSVYEVDDANAAGFRSILTLDVDKYIDPTYLHLLYGMSKDMAGGGLRLGCIYSRNEDLLRAMSVISPFNWPASSSERIATIMLEDVEWMDQFLLQSCTRLAAQNRMTRQLLDDQGIPYYRDSNAGLFLWINLLPNISKGHFAEDNFKEGWKCEDKVTQALIKNGVFLTSGKDMNAEEPGWYRFIFAQDERYVKEALKRIVETVKSNRF